MATLATSTMQRPTSKPRHRVAAACATCRGRHTRCILQLGETCCDRCRSGGLECVFETCDERKKPKSKEFVTSLLGKIDSLERRLRDAGQEPPEFHGGDMQATPLLWQSARQSALQSAQQSPRACQSSQFSADSDSACLGSTAPSIEFQPPWDKDSCPPATTRNRGEGALDSTTTTKSVTCAALNANPLPQHSPTGQATVWNLIYGPQRLIYDRQKGRINYFSPSTCFKASLKHESPHESSHLNLSPYRLLADVPADVDDYLMDLFWNRYNNTLRVLDRASFLDDQAHGGFSYYSAFLHLVCLAMGFLFADKDRPGIHDFTLTHTNSVFHREAKDVLDQELEYPDGLTIIQAMLVLSDVECAAGREDLAAMHVKTTCRLAFDFGLNLDCTGLGLTEPEMNYRKHLLRSCIVYDRIWALYLGRPTAIKGSDLSDSCLTRRPSIVQGSTLSSNTQVSSEPVSSEEDDSYDLVLDALVELSELSANVQELAQPRITPGVIADENRLLEVASLETKLKIWYSKLPRKLKWTAANVTDAPRLFYIMYQQYHVSQLLLHGPYGHYEDVLGLDLKTAHVFERRVSSEGNVSTWQHLARKITIDSAMNIVKGMSTYRKTFGTFQTSVFSLQHGGTAFLALMSSIAAIKDTTQRTMGLQSLSSLMDHMKEMSQIYHPAKVMCRVAQREMERLGIDLDDSTIASSRAERPLSPSFSTTGQPLTIESGDETGSPAKRRRLCYEGGRSKASARTPRDNNTYQESGSVNATPTAVSEESEHNVPASDSLSPIKDRFAMPQTSTDALESSTGDGQSMLDSSAHSFAWPMELLQMAEWPDLIGHNHHISNNFLLSFLPDAHHLDGLDPDPTPRTQNAITEFG